MEPPVSKPPPVLVPPRNLQPCDRDCVHFEELPELPDWGWCRDPGCPFRQGLVRPGTECPRFTVRTYRERP